jgi:hypothetical protein
VTTEASVKRPYPAPADKRHHDIDLTRRSNLSLDLMSDPRLARGVGKESCVQERDERGFQGFERPVRLPRGEATSDPSEVRTAGLQSRQRQSAHRVLDNDMPLRSALSRSSASQNGVQSETRDLLTNKGGEGGRSWFRLVLRPGRRRHASPADRMVGPRSSPRLWQTDRWRTYGTQRDHPGRPCR